MILGIGEVIAATGKTRKPKTVYERLMAEDDGDGLLDGLLHEGPALTVTDRLPKEDADISDLYLCQPMSFVKVAQRRADNDLVENEARVLTHLNANLKPESTFYHYIPRLIQAFKHEDHAGVALSYAEEFVSLAQVIRAYPKGLDFRDMVWMYKRLLVGLGFAHSRGVLHGAVLPTHVLVHPTKHGAVIIDWSYAVTDPNDRIKAMSVPGEDFYPPEVRRREAPKTGTDLFMAAKCAVALLGGDIHTDRMPDTVPQEIQDFFHPSLDPDMRHRPQDAWGLHEQFDAVLQKLVGTPAYRPFKMPEET